MNMILGAFPNSRFTQEGGGDVQKGRREDMLMWTYDANTD